MVMAFKEETPGQQAGGPLNRLASTLGKSFFSTERLDIHQTAAKYSNPDPGMSKLKKGVRDMRVASGKTYTEVELPEAASLIYPNLDRVIEDDRGIQQDGEQIHADKTGIKDKFKGAGAWFQDYRDRKAQATFVSKYLSLPPPLMNFQADQLLRRETTRVLHWRCLRPHELGSLLASTTQTIQPTAAH